MQPSTVLFLAANPMRVQPLQLGEECRAIEGRIHAAKFRDQIRFRSRWAARPDDLLQALNEDTPLVLHFSGHGEGDQGLCFQSEDGGAQHVSAEGLAQVMQAAGACVMVVVLNACYSEVQAQALVTHVPCVVGMPDAIGDETAIIYAASFYGALAFGKSVANAHQQGLAALALRPSDGPTRHVKLAEVALCAPTPRLLTRPDTDANCIYIVREPKKRVVIVIKATLNEFNSDVLARITDELRQWTGDLSLQITDVEEGSVLLTVSLSPAAARVLTELRANGQLTQICGFEVSAIVKPYAAVMAAQAEGDAADALSQGALRGTSTALRSRSFPLHIPPHVLPAGQAVRLSPSPLDITIAEPAWSPPAEFEEYRLVRALGRGAMGQVYLAHDLLLDRVVAVKFVHGSEDPAARARLIEEARAIARLQHANIVAIHRVGEIAGHPYLVSEYVRGCALDQLDRPLPWRQVLDIALDLTRGLAAAHRRGILHRDIKPANAILTAEGQAKLCDFGLARVVDSRLTQDGAAAPPPERSGDHDQGSRSLAAVDETALLSSRTMTGRNSTASAPFFDDQDARAGRSGGIVTLRPRDASNDITLARTDPPPHLVGTPRYMAPEIWRGDRTTHRSDLYSLGILLYELLAGAVPHHDISMTALASAVQDRDAPRLRDVVPGIEPVLAAIVDRLVKRDPGTRFASADALLIALEERAAPSAVDGHPDDNPYRGLAAFESAHRSLFFGRRGEVRKLVDRVRTEAFVVVGGDSGSGKSSLCRAGALPWLAEHDGWSCVEIVPGRHPVRSLAAALAAWTGIAETELAVVLRESPDAFARAIHQHIVAQQAPKSAGTDDSPPRASREPPRRLLLFVDQLEELLTLSESEEARVVAAALAALAGHTPPVRVLANGRSDFLSRLARLPRLGDEMTRGLYFLRPLTGDHIREVIILPAAAKGVTYESEALISLLVDQTEHAPGGLPLLQLTLAEAWDARDVGARMIRAETLAALGGVGGALTRHADRLLAGLPGDERNAARRILLRLVTAEGTRARRPQAELVTEGAERDAERAALEVLVRGRILVANDDQGGAYEIAHEALLTSWSMLQGWLQLAASAHSIRTRVEQAATAWDRMGRPRDLLWGRRQLAEARALDRDRLAPREAAFLAAAGTAILRRRLVGTAVAAVLVIGAVIVGLEVRAKARRELASVVTDQVHAAATGRDAARQLAAQRDAARDRSFGLFDEHRWSEGEDAWAAGEALAAQEEHQYRIASGHLESALLLDPTRAGLRDHFADLTFERLLRAERDHHRDLADELAARLVEYDDGRHQAQRDAAAHVALEIIPAGTRVWSERPGAPRQLVGQAPLSTLSLPPGSVVISFEAPGHVAARLPVLLSRGQTLALQIALPETASAPPGMIYVPPGRFLFGSAEDFDVRQQFLRTAPLHEVSTAAYFIARYEVTFAEWIEFLDNLTPDERRRRSPRSNNAVSSVTLTEIGSARWRLSLTTTTRTYTAETGQRLHYDGRARRADQDWMKFPVSAVSYEDAVAFAEWLDRTRRIPGARLCDEYEWERAARGADGRRFPTGATLAPDDANIDVTYGRQPLAFGPDEVGSHPGSRSPVGADDMAGNVWEWTRSVQTPGMPVTRGGGWYSAATSARSMNREYGEPTEHHPSIGVRLCVTSQ
jgi:eukaryotic-like serine/threonine-protein kinase